MASLGRTVLCNLRPFPVFIPIFFLPSPYLKVLHFFCCNLLGELAEKHEPSELRYWIQSESQISWLDVFMQIIYFVMHNKCCTVR